MRLKQVISSRQLKRLKHQSAESTLIVELASAADSDVSLTHLLCVCVYHAGGAPDVCRWSILCSNQDLQSSVLSGLNVLSEVFVLDERDRDRSLSDWSALCIDTTERKRRRQQNHLTTQHAFPKSAIFTLSLWALRGSRGLRTKSEALNAETHKQEVQHDSVRLVTQPSVCIRTLLEPTTYCEGNPRSSQGKKENVGHSSVAKSVT